MQNHIRYILSKERLLGCGIGPLGAPPLEQDAAQVEACLVIPALRSPPVHADGRRDVGLATEAHLQHPAEVIQGLGVAALCGGAEPAQRHGRIAVDAAALPVPYAQSDLKHSLSHSVNLQSIKIQ